MMPAGSGTCVVVLSRHLVKREHVLWKVVVSGMHALIESSGQVLQISRSLAGGAG
jgi:hypothetical protein